METKPDYALEIKPISAPYVLPVKMNDEKITVQRFNGHFKLEDIRQYAQKFSNDLKEKDFKGSMDISIEFCDHLYNGHPSKVGDTVSLAPDKCLREVDYFNRFHIYWWKDPKVNKN